MFSKLFIPVLFASCLFTSIEASADQIKLLEQNIEGLQARVDLIQNAKSEILVEYYEVANDAFSMTGLSLLKNAAEKGIKVKILIDALHNHLSDEQMAAITAKNIEIKVFNPIHSINPLHLLYRNHEKLLNVDGNTDQAYMIVGGRNAASNYFGKSREINFKDTDALVSGNAAKESYKYFMDLWNLNPDVKTVNLHEYSKDKMNKNCEEESSEQIINCQKAINKKKLKILETEKAITSYFDYFKEGNAWVKDEPITELLKDIETVDDIKFVFNETNKSMNKIENKLCKQIMNSLLTNAHDNILIITPYLFPTEEELQTLEKLTNKGIKIKIVTNSLESTDVVIVHAGFLKIKKRIANMGIEIYLYNGPETLHSKGAVIDNKISFIGSFNFDRKSANFNREIGIKVGTDTSEASQFTQEFERFINDQVIANSTLATKDKIEFSLVESEKNVSLEKKKKLNNSKILVEIFKNII